ncbi:hypothetical protein, partial [Methylobacterium frigidaeris]|uniref:hypothetical protein n=1 Tax=Methylobacterium frigidaeris TaxID=2038277 RepID=UPI001A9C62FF
RHPRMNDSLGFVSSPTLRSRLTETFENAVYRKLYVCRRNGKPACYQAIDLSSRIEAKASSLHDA